MKTVEQKLTSFFGDSQNFGQAQCVSPLSCSVSLYPAITVALLAAGFETFLMERARSKST